MHIHKLRSSHPLLARSFTTTLPRFEDQTPTPLNHSDISGARGKDPKQFQGNVNYAHIITLLTSSTLGRLNCLHDMYVQYNVCKRKVKGISDSVVL